MDSITHIVLGACVGEALGGKKLGKKAMLWGAIANSIPDIDVVTSFWMSQADGLLAHRGFTHSILFCLIVTALAGWGMKKIFPKIDFSFKDWSALFGINLFLHLLIDSFTSYGTGLLEPFSHERISFNILFVADPFFTISLLIAAIALLIMKRKSSKRFKVAAAGIMISSVYLCYALVHKAEVYSIAKASLNKLNNDQEFVTTPTPLNNFLWYIIAHRTDGFDVGYYSVFDHSKEIQFHFIPQNDSLVETLNDDNDVKKLIRFSQGYFQIKKINDTLVFSDLRFGQIGGWGMEDAPFVFQFKLGLKANNDVFIQKGRMKATSGKPLESLIERIKGN